MAAVEPLAPQAFFLASLGRRAVHAVHIGRRPAQVIDIALEIRMPGQAADLVEDRFFAPRYDPVPLMEGQGAERAAPDAAAVRDD